VIQPHHTCITPGQATTHQAHHWLQHVNQLRCISHLLLLVLLSPEPAATASIMLPLLLLLPPLQLSRHNVQLPVLLLLLSMCATSLVL
jgi:hypothetical protein